METIQATLSQIAQLQLVNTQTLNRLSDRVDSLVAQVEVVTTETGRTSQQFDSFIYESQRLFNRIGETSIRNEAAIETLVASIAALNRRSDETRSQFEASQQRNDAMISRLDGLVDYLMRQG